MAASAGTRTNSHVVFVVADVLLSETPASFQALFQALFVIWKHKTPAAFQQLSWSQNLYFRVPKAPFWYPWAPFGLPGSPEERLWDP